MTWRTTILCCALVGGCATERPLERVHVPMTLAELPGLEIYFWRYLSDRLWNPSGNSFSAQLSYRTRDLIDEDAGFEGCAQLDDSLTATINGVPIEISERGHWPEAFPDEPCVAPTFGLARIPDELKVDRATVIVQDSSRSITAELGDAFLPRTAVPLGAADWQFQLGQTLEVQWSSAGDLTSGTPSVTFLGPTDPPQDHIEFQILSEAIEKRDGAISFTLPELTLDGTMFIEFSGGDPDLPCGDVTCRLHGGQRFYHDATISL